jgi:hypothetical protein
VTGPFAFLLGSALVCVSATAGVALLRLRSAIDIVLAWALLATSVVVSTLLVAGAALDHLAVWVVLVLNAAVAAVAVTAALAAGSRLRFPSPRLRASARAAALAVRSDLWLAALLLVAAASLLWRLLIAYLMPPYANDALWYHLTTIGGWLQNGQIGPSEFTIWSTVYPYNGELLFTWPALLLGNDTFVDAGQLPFAGVGAVAVAGIARTVGLSRRGAVAAGCLFLLSPIVLSQTTASYVDLIFSALFLTSFHFTLRFVVGLRRGGGRTVHVLLAGVAGGLALGTKDLGVVYLGVLVVLLGGYLLAEQLRGRVSPSALAAAALAFALPLLALGSYHYLEVWARFGNPVYPVRVAPFGVELFHGRSLEWFLTPPLRPGPWWREVWGQWSRDYFFLVHPRFHAYSYDDRSSGLGPLWSYLGLPLLVVFAFRLYRANRFMLVSLLLPVAAMFALQPYRWWSRFTMVVVAVGTIAIVAIVEVLPRRWATALKTAVLFFVALGIFFPTLKIDGKFWASRIVAFADIPANERTIGRIAVPAYRWVDGTPSGATIGVDTSVPFVGAEPDVIAFPLFGRNFEHEVEPLPQRSLVAFTRALSSENVRYIFVRKGRRLDRWARLLARNGCARKVYDGPVYGPNPGRAYALRPGCALRQSRDAASEHRQAR